ncbi:hypothetical protein FRB90_004851 [Tulasnella sp. 427]|nr:hypothetical protein FRB90_004851 [Tulasnella sp. 427]
MSTESTSEAAPVDRLPNLSQPLSKAPIKYPRDIYAHHGQRIIEDHLATKFTTENRRRPVLVPGPADGTQQVGTKDKVHYISVATGENRPIPARPVGILGAGVGGLYTAMILESLGIPFEIMEASGRTGGRLYTHHFYQGDKHDYFLNPLNGDRLSDKLIPYLFDSVFNNTFYYYNGVRTIGNNPIGTYDFQATGVDPRLLAIGAKTLLKEQVLDDFVPQILHNLRHGGHSGWDHLERSDKYSTRGYMTIVKNLDEVTVDWIESMTFGTGWFDKALSELVIEYIAFSEFLAHASYHCLDGGSRVLPDFMTKYIKDKCPKSLHLGKRVTRITYTGRPSEPGPDTPIRVHVEGEATPRDYGHVISTLPLPVLRSLDIADAGLDVMQTNALRQLQYGPSEKIGVKFRTQWWRTGMDLDGTPFNIVGGQSFSDCVGRTVVYPSYGIPGHAPESTVLIASYSWTEDALRLGSMISAGGLLKNQVKDLVLRDLAKIHNVPYDMLNEEYEDHFGWDWTHDPLTQGAFAFFGPGEFPRLYKSLTRAAAGGRLHFAGEALSTRHAWVVGALDSAWRAVKEMLWISYPQLIRRFETLWGNNEEWIITDELKRAIGLPEQPGRNNEGGEGGDQHEVERDLILLQLFGHLSDDFPIGELPADPQPE